MTPATLVWLSHRVPDFVNLPEEERNAIVDFSFLWSLFEGTVMNGRCDVPGIREYVSGLACRDELRSLDCQPYLEYLKNRYYRNGEVTHHFHHLHIERNRNPEEVMVALSNEEATKEVKVVGCLIIIYRLRNNLFHGEKWQYQLRGQRDNFTFANEFIKCLMQ